MEKHLRKIKCNGKSQFSIHPQIFILESLFLTVIALPFIHLSPSLSLSIYFYHVCCGFYYEMEENTQHHQQSGTPQIILLYYLPPGMLISRG